MLVSNSDFQKLQCESHHVGKIEQRSSIGIVASGMHLVAGSLSWGRSQMWRMLGSFPVEKIPAPNISLKCEVIKIWV